MLVVILYLAGLPLAFVALCWIEMNFVENEIEASSTYIMTLFWPLTFPVLTVVWTAVFIGQMLEGKSGESFKARVCAKLKSGTGND